ncbi:Probable trehalose-phosphate phosphatase E [Linum perenne]
MANNLWVDSMRASSPTRSTSTSTSFNLPNALHSFNEILKASKEKKIVMFLDYDGTLAPIVNNPDETFMSPQVRTFVNLPQLHYVGSHRLDLKGPNQGEIYQPAHEFLKLIADVFNELTKKTQSIPGCLVENNRFSVAVHFHCVAEDKWNNVAELVDSVLNTYPNLRLLRGQMIH